MVSIHITDVVQYLENAASRRMRLDAVLSSGLAENLSQPELASVVWGCQDITTVGGVHLFVYLIQGPDVSDIPGEHPHPAGIIESLYLQPAWRLTYTSDTGDPSSESRPDKHVVISHQDTALENLAPTEHFHRIRRMAAVREA